jgi:hypothetical protein
VTHSPHTAGVAHSCAFFAHEWGTSTVCTATLRTTTAARTNAGRIPLKSHSSAPLKPPIPEILSSPPACANLPIPNKPNDKIAKNSLRVITTQFSKIEIDRKRLQPAHSGLWPFPFNPINRTASTGALSDLPAILCTQLLSFEPLMETSFPSTHKTKHFRTKYPHREGGRGGPRRAHLLAGVRGGPLAPLP